MVAALSCSQLLAGRGCLGGGSGGGLWESRGSNRLAAGNCRGWQYCRAFAFMEQSLIRASNGAEQTARITEAGREPGKRR